MEQRSPPTAPALGPAPDLQAQLRALRRVAVAAARPGGAELFAHLVGELADALGAAVAMVAVYADDAHGSMRTLAVRLDGAELQNFDYPLEGSPCAQVRGTAFHFLAGGARFPPGTLFSAKGMDSYAAFPIVDSDGTPLGLVAAMDRRPIAGGDAEHAEAMLKVVAGRLSAEIERARTDEALRSAALAVSSSVSGTVFDELVRLLATILRVEVAFIARHEAADPEGLRILAMHSDGQILRDIRYQIAGTPCETVLGRQYRAYASGVRERFPDDADAFAQCTEGYAGYPLTALDGTSLGIVSVASRRPLSQLGRVEAMLKIFAVRAAAEIERLAASEALQRSAASYRAIFDAAEDSIFIHDWDSNEILDANPKACRTYGYGREELRGLSTEALSAGVPPYSAREAAQWVQLAKLGRCPPFEWQRRNKDGSLHWDEVRLKPAVIHGQPHIVAFTRDITQAKQAVAALSERQEQYRAIFDGSVDPMVLWSSELRVVDVNDAFVRVTGLQRAQVLGMTAAERPDAEDLRRLLPLIERALGGSEAQAVERVCRADGSLFDIELRYLPVRFGGKAYALGVGRDVSERLEHERALARSEARLRATVEAAFDCIVGMDGEGRIVEFNAAAERSFGHRREDVLGRQLADVLLPVHQRAAHARGLRNFHAGVPGPMLGRLVETTALRADGTEVPVELAIGVAAVPEGSIFVGHLRDITERRRTDRALRESEAQYRGIFNASADALVLRDAEFRIVDVNATYEAMSGYSRAEVLGLDRVLANPVEVGSTIRALHARALHGEPVSLDTQLLRRDGRRYELELRGVPVLHRGEPHVLYIGRDMTQRRRADEALRDSEAQYRAIFNASADGLVLRDAEFRIVEVNPAYLAMSGYTRREALGATRLPGQSGAAQEAALQAHGRVLGGELLRVETAETRKDGSSFPAEVRGMPVVYRGRPHVLYVSRDISERRQAEAQRSELEHRLRQAQKMEAIGQLTGGIAHDFNNILTSVIGYLVLGEERAQALGDAKLERQLAQAQLAAERARDLIAQMLAFARRQRGAPRVLELAPLVRQTLGLLRPTLPSSIVIDSELGEGESLAVSADPVQLEQVLFNLCINARDAMAGAGRIRVRLTALGALPADAAQPPAHCASCRARLDGGAWVELSVADSGSGIAPELLERIFDPFFSTKPPGQGTGMGLAMVHGIVHDHGGHLHVSTAPGEGSRFAVLLPQVAPAAQAAGARPAAAVPARPAGLHGRVLVVEDDVMVGDYLAEQLSAWGLQAVLEREPHAALARLEDPAFALDLLITDHTMPQMTGLQLARQAAALRPGLAIWLASGNLDVADTEALARAGVAATLPKPIAVERLRALLGAHFSAATAATAEDPGG